MSHIIRTSDRGTFRKCRQLWDFTSKIRMNYESVTYIIYLEFGIAMHEALSVWYKPETWNADRRLVAQMAINAFKQVNHNQMINAAQARSPDGIPSDEIKEDYAERKRLGIGMLKHYFIWSASRDKFKPVYAEIEFEVPIIAYPGVIPTPYDSFGFDYKSEKHPLTGKTEYHLYYQGEPVVYQGRIDLIVEDEDGYWIWDHKTAARFDSTEWVDKDPQVSSYVWAAQYMGIQTNGFVMNQLRKAVPDKPAVLQSPRLGRGLSVSKSQATTYELYLETIRERGEAPEMYEDILQHLKAENDEAFFRRINVDRTSAEIQYAGQQILWEAIDMLGNPFIYPNASLWNCRGCQFAGPCGARMDGHDWQYILDNDAFYQIRPTEGGEAI